MREGGATPSAGPSGADCGKALTPQTYPDISDILARKQEGRVRAARRTLAEKIDWLERAREDLRPFAALREARRAARKQVAGKPAEPR